MNFSKLENYRCKRLILFNQFQLLIRIRVVRENAMERLGGKKCCNCGCDDFSILEINHINGGGRKELKGKQNRQLYRDIVNDKVNLDEYNVLCRICNALHYVAQILGIKGHQVLWRDSIIG